MDKVIEKVMEVALFAGTAVFVILTFYNLLTAVSQW